MTGEASRSQEEEQSEDGDARRDEPAAFHAIHNSVQELNERRQQDECVQNVFGPQKQRPNQQNGQRGIARKKIVGVNMNGGVDFVMRRDEHGRIQERYECARRHEERTQEDYRLNPPGESGGFR